MPAASTAPSSTRPVRRGPGRPRGGRLLADREQLLEAAERTVRAHGPDVTMEEIAAAATVTKPILYRSVGNKDAVVAAVAERLVERIDRATAAATASAAPGRDGVRAVIAAYVEVIDADRELFRFVTGSGTGQHHGSLELADRSAATLAAPLADALRAAGRDPAAAITWAYGVIGMLQLVTQWWLRDGTRSGDEVTEHLTDLVWSGLSGLG